MKNIRSLLFVPAVEKKMQNIGHFEEEPDAYIIDIEDSIKLEAKEDALHSVIRYLNNSIYLEKIYVRINKEFWERDIDYLIKNNINRVVFPKAEDDGEIKKVIAKYSDIEIIALIETPKGILHVENICQLDNVVALAFGGEDYFALLGVPYSYEASLYPKSKIVICSNAYGKSCFDTIYPSVRNVQGLIDATNLSKKLGFSGKLAIHPNQIKIIDDIFTQEDMDKYRKILEKYESDKSGVIEFEGRIYEKPHIEMLKRILDDFEVN